MLRVCTESMTVSALVMRGEQSLHMSFLGNPGTGNVTFDSTLIEGFPKIRGSFLSL